MVEKQFYAFGPFRLDVALNRLERAGEVVPLPPKAFDLLVLLADNPHRVMAKAELMSALWPDTFVEEANLTQHIYMLRKALGEQPDGQPYVDTVPRRGYRLASTVSAVTTDAQPGAAPAPVVLAAPRSPAAAPPPAALLEGERKQATLIHCRIAQAAAIVERGGPAAMRDLVAELFALAAEEMRRYEGLITHRHADSFVAIFGVPAVHEDDPRRATLAAMAVQRRFRTLAPRDVPDEERPDLQIGVSTGSVVISRAMRDDAIEYLAVGESAKTADLLAQLADPGSILISAATERAVEGYIEVAGTRIDVAGTTASRVVRALPAAARPARVRRTLAPFVGRRHEVAWLEDLAAEAGGGTGRVVSIVGEPGVGKSRLLHEFAETVVSRGPMTLLEGRCVSYGSLVPYLPLADLVRTQCDLVDRDEPDTMRAAVGRVVRDHGLPAHAATWLLRLMGGVDGDPAAETLSPEAMKARTFEALRQLFFKVSARAPLVIVIEDIHWIDRTSEEFLATLVERLVASRMMVVATYRPGYRVPWMDRSCVSQITLTPLRAADSARLLESVAGERPLPASVSATILDKAEGNPFFLEELAWTLAERGPDAQGIPDTVQGVIMARIDRLPETAKRLLQTASILGREVPLPLLARLCDQSDFSAEVAELCRLEFLYEKPGGEETALVFKHALTQDVAYDSLLARNRRALHLRAAEALAALYGDRRDDLAATFAYHYARTDCIDEAVQWLTRAADGAARVYANAEAILHLDLAARRLQRLPEGPARDRRMLDVALRHAHSLYFLGRFRESVEILLPHEARLNRLAEPGLTAAYAFWLAHMYSRLGDQRRAAEQAHRAIDAATRAGDQATLGKAHGLLALEGHWSGETASGIHHGREAIALLGPLLDQRWWLGMAHFYVAMNYVLTGEFEAGLEQTARADAVGKEIGDPRLQTYAGFTIGWIETMRGRSGVAIDVCRRSLEQAPDRVSRAYASMFLGNALLEHGDPAQALDRLRPAVIELEGFGFPQWTGLAHALIGEALRQGGDLSAAADATRMGIETATRARYWYGVAVGERVLARLARDRGCTEEAAAAFQRAREVFQKIGVSYEAGRTVTEEGHDESP